MRHNFPASHCCGREQDGARSRHSEIRTEGVVEVDALEAELTLVRDGPGLGGNSEPEVAHQ
jgi:hypothetical protein